MPSKRRRKLNATRVLPDLVRQLLAIGDPDELLARVLGLCNDFVGADEVSLLLVDGKELVEHVIQGRTLRKEKHRIRIGAEGLSGFAAGKRATVVVPDVRKDSRYVQASKATRSEAAVPILAGDRLLGVLNFESSKVGFFSRNDRNLLELLAAQIAIGLRLDEVHRRSSRLATELQMLNHLGRAATSLDPKAFVQRVADIARMTFQCLYCGIFVGDYEREEVVLIAHSSGRPVSFGPGERQAFSRGMIGAAFRLGETVVANDVRKDPNYAEAVPGVLSEIDVPIRMGDHCLGILDAQSEELNSFSDDEVQTLETLARSLVPTIQGLQVRSTPA